MSGRGSNAGGAGKGLTTSGSKSSLKSGLEQGSQKSGGASRYSLQQTKNSGPVKETSLVSPPSAGSIANEITDANSRFGDPTPQLALTASTHPTPTSQLEAEIGIPGDAPSMVSGAVNVEGVTSVHSTPMQKPVQNFSSSHSVQSQEGAPKAHMSRAGSMGGNAGNLQALDQSGRNPDEVSATRSTNVLQSVPSANFAPISQQQTPGNHDLTLPTASAKNSADIAVPRERPQHEDTPILNSASLPGGGPGDRGSFRLSIKSDGVEIDLGRPADGRGTPSKELPPTQSLTPRVQPSPAQSVLNITTQSVPSPTHRAATPVLTPTQQPVTVPKSHGSSPGTPSYQTTHGSASQRPVMGQSPFASATHADPPEQRRASMKQSPKKDPLPQHDVPIPEDDDMQVYESYLDSLREAAITLWDDCLSRMERDKAPRADSSLLDKRLGGDKRLVTWDDVISLRENERAEQYHAREQYPTKRFEVVVNNSHVKPKTPQSLWVTESCRNYEQAYGVKPLSASQEREALASLSPARAPLSPSSQRRDSIPPSNSPPHGVRSIQQTKHLLNKSRLNPACENSIDAIARLKRLKRLSNSPALLTAPRLSSITKGACPINPHHPDWRLSPDGCCILPDGRVLNLLQHTSAWKA